MKQKDLKNLVINLSILVEAVASAEFQEDAADVANVATDFVRSTLREIPVLREKVDEILGESDWDTSIAWIQFEKTL